jgi:hypothetical protein
MLNYVGLAVGRVLQFEVPDQGTDPTPPGQEQLKELVGTIRNWSIIACVIAIIVAAILWAWGSQSQNAAQATQGKKGILVAVAAAAVIFAAEALVNWGIRLGDGVADSATLFLF